MMSHKIMIHGVVLPVLAMLLMTGKPESKTEHENVEASAEQNQQTTPETADPEAEVRLNNEEEMPAPDTSSVSTSSSTPIDDGERMEQENQETADEQEVVTVEQALDVEEALEQQQVTVEASVTSSPQVRVSVTVQSNGGNLPQIFPVPSNLELSFDNGLRNRLNWTNEMRTRTPQVAFERTDVTESMDRIFKATDSAVTMRHTSSHPQVLSVSCNKQGSKTLVTMVYIDSKTGEPVQLSVKGSRKEVESKISELPTSLRSYVEKYLK